MKFQTRLLHGKAVDTYANGATVPPVSFANAFAYETSEQLEKVFQNRAPGFAYSRIANPTVDAFERRVNGTNGDTELFKKSRNINGFRACRIANNLY